MRNGILAMLVCFELCLLQALDLTASSRTPEETVVRQLAIAVGLYSKQHEGKPPSDWDDFKGLIDLEVLGHHAPAPLKERYTFAKNLPNMLPPETGRIVLLGAHPIRERGRNAKGRYVIWQTPEGEVLHKWLRETEVLTALQGVSAEVGQPKQLVRLTLDVTNQRRILLRDEPLCIFAKAEAKEEEIPDKTDFQFELNGPDGKLMFPLHTGNFLNQKIVAAEVPFAQEPSGKLVASFHAVVIVPLDVRKTDREPKSLRTITNKTGAYSILLRESNSGCVSDVARFTVIDPSGEDHSANAVFASAAGMKCLSGATEDFSAYESLIEKFPNSKYSGYAAFFVGREKFQRTTNEVARFEPTSKEKGPRAPLSQYFRKVLSLEFPSLFHAKALYFEGICRWDDRQFEDGFDLFKTLATTYHVTTGLPEAQLASAAILEYERIKTSVTVQER